MDDISNYQKLRQNAQEYYSAINKVYCPVFKNHVHFSAEGFNHIMYKGSRSERDKNSQIMRFKLLPMAKKLVEITTTYQEFEETLQEFTVKRYKKREKRSLPVRYWGIIAILEGRKIKVIIRQIGENGSLQFWSIVPAWVTNKYRDIKFVTTMKGNPEED